MNRIFIFILLLALLYALYRYQKSMNENEKEREKRTPKKNDNVSKIPSNLENISQMSMGSLGDVKSFGNININIDDHGSAMDSCGSLGSLDNVTRDEK